MDEEDVVLNEEDIEEIIELDDDDELEDEEMDEGASKPIQDDSTLKFSQHEGSVFCCCVSACGSLAATGGEDDRAFLWNTASGEVVLECKGHVDSVTSIGFNHDSSLLATADMSGKIKIWNVKDKTELTELETSDICWMKWHKSANVLVTGTSDGCMWMWKVPSGECKSFPGHGQPTNSGLILNDGKRAASGYEDGVIKIWDLKSMEATFSISGKDAHKGNVICLDSNSQSLLASGSTEGIAKLINVDNGKVLTSFACANSADSPEADNDVESVAFCHGQPMLATGTLNGNLDIWDLNKQSARFNCVQDRGITKIVWAASQPSVLLTAGVDGTIRLWDSRKGTVAHQWEGHESYILDVALTPDTKRIITSCDDKTARIFSISDDILS